MPVLDHRRRMSPSHMPASRARIVKSRTRAARFMISSLALVSVLGLLFASPATAFRATFSTNTIASATYKASGANSSI